MVLAVASEPFATWQFFPATGKGLQDFLARPWIL
jgi:hypothetical protein